jgi:hypothetical protein
MSSKARKASLAVWFPFLRFSFFFIHPVNKIVHAWSSSREDESSYEQLDLESNKLNLSGEKFD